MIETPKLFIRKLEKKDFNFLYEIKNEKEVIFWEGHYFSFSYEKFEKIYSEYFNSNDVILKTIIEKETDKIIGEIVIYCDWVNKKAEIGISISKNFQGKGYGTSTILAVTRYFIEKLLFVRVEAKILQTNIASQKAFLKAGFEQEGVLRKYKLHDGKYTDMLVLSCIS